MNRVLAVAMRCAHRVRMRLMGNQVACCDSLPGGPADMSDLRLRYRAKTRHHGEQAMPRRLDPQGRRSIPRMRGHRIEVRAP